MTNRSTFLTHEGMQKLNAELDFLRTVRRQQVAHRLHAAMQEGDIQENAEYEDAKNEQAFVESRILTVEFLLKTAVLIENEGPSDHVGLGSKVTVVDISLGEDGAELETYHVVGSTEADPIAGRISNESPLGQAMMGRQVDNEVTISAPDGVLTFKIVSIE